MPFESHLELRHRPGYYRWDVIQPLIYRHDAPRPALSEGSASRRIVVPIGYRSDLVSVPRLARWLVDSQHLGTRRPAVVHDYLYTDLTHRFSKREADRIFYDALLEEGTSRPLAWLMWKAVHLGGRGNWGKKGT